MKLLSKSEIKTLIKKKGYTIVEVAEKLGISSSSFHQKLNRWNEKKQIELYKVLNIPIENVAVINESPHVYNAKPASELAKELIECEKEKEELLQINRFLQLEIMKKETELTELKKNNVTKD